MFFQGEDKKQLDLPQMDPNRLYYFKVLLAWELGLSLEKPILSFFFALTLLHKTTECGPETLSGIGRVRFTADRKKTQHPARWARHKLRRAGRRPRLPMTAVVSSAKRWNPAWRAQPTPMSVSRIRLLALPPFHRRGIAGITSIILTVRPKPVVTGEVI